MSQSKAGRFSDAAVEVLVQQVRARQELFFPRDGGRMPRQTVRQAWKEVALSVNGSTHITRTGMQCRKKFNDLTRSARDKLAHKPRKRTCIQDLTQMEQEALDIIWIASRRGMENGLYHYLGPAVQEMEGDHLTDDALSPAATFQYTSTGISGGGDGHLEGYTVGESFINNEQELAKMARTVQEMDGRRTSSGPSYAEEDKEGDFNSPPFKRKIFHVHHQLLEALDSLSRSCLTLSESMEESTSILCGILPQGLTTLESSMERMTSSVEAVVRPSVQEPVAPALTSLIKAQTGAIQALACTISSGLERLGCCIDRGFGRVTNLLQSALPQVSVESLPHGSGAIGVAHAALAREDSSSVPSAPPQPPTVPQPGSWLDLTVPQP